MLQKKEKSQKTEFILFVITLLIIAIAWYVGTFRARVDIAPFLNNIIPEADVFEQLPEGIYAAKSDTPNNKLIGYLSTGSYDGYGGNLNLMLALNSDGEITNITLIDHNETPSFYQKVIKKGFLTQFNGKLFSESFQLNNDVDVISGATSTCRAINGAIRQASRNIASNALSKIVPEEPAPSIQFGFPEINIIILFILGYIGTLKFFKPKKILRWILLLSGLLILGFIYNIPLNTIYINNILMGSWPEWQTNMYLYLLVGLILFFLLILNKNIYCERLCPFGATQECISFIGGADKQIPQKYRQYLIWLQRALALSVVVFALIFRNPGILSYEVFSAFFHLLGNILQFVLLGLVLTMSLFIKRPWCNYLCPVKPVYDYIHLFRKLIFGIKIGSRLS